MDKIAEKILGYHRVLQTLLEQIDGDAPGALALLATKTMFRAMRTDSDIVLDMYNTGNGRVYILAYAIGSADFEHIVLFAKAYHSNSDIYLLPQTVMCPLRIITFAADSVELVGFPALEGERETTTPSEHRSFIKHFDAAEHAAIGELLAVLRGENIDPVTELGRIAKETAEW